MKKVSALLITLVLILSLFPVPALAARDITLAEKQAQLLKDYGLFMGDSNGNFNLQNVPKRAEALVMLIRLLGKEKEAENFAGSTPFTDINTHWARHYITYAYANKLTTGATASTFNPEGKADAQMYLTFVLRALGYSDAANKDFTYSDPYTLARSTGILTGSVDTNNFLRADVVLVSYAALSASLKGTRTTLLEKLGLAEEPHEIDLIKITASGPDELYKNLNAALEKFPHKIEITPTGAWESIDIKELFDYSFDCAATYCSSMKSRYNPNVLTIIPDYSDASLALAYKLGWRESADANITTLLSRAEDIIKSLKLDGLEQSEAVKAIHDYIAANTRYNFTNGDSAYTAYGVLVEGSGVCDGYSYAFWLLCSLAGINCVRVSGTATADGISDLHAWNKVQVDGLWYNVDVTWDDPVFYYNGVLTDTIRYEYFLISDAVIAADHQWYQYEAMPAA
jgi:hypothetical protein